LKFSTNIFFINKDDQKDLVGNNNSDKKYNFLSGEGINTEHFKKTDRVKNSMQFKFLLVARMLWDKGIGEYIEAAKLISASHTDVEFGLVGQLDTENPSAIEKWQMDIWTRENKNIRYYGETDDIRDYIEKSDCVVLPSYREGHNIVLSEAASMSKPIIATDVPGCRNIVDDGENGFLCEVKNSQDLATKMIKMMSLGDEKRAKMGRLGRAKAIAEFDENIVIEKYLGFIEELFATSNI
jgi:glycosyltransferase involved in cell wall biosynthesis